MPTSILDLMNNVENGFDQGRARVKQSKLADLYKETYTAPASQRPALFGQIAGVGGLDAATNAQTALGQMDDRKHAAIGRAAQMILAAPEEARPGLWSQIVSDLSAEGITGMKPDYDPVAVPKMAQQIAQAYGQAGLPSAYKEFDLLARDAKLSPEDRATAARRALYLERRPSNAATGYKMVEGEDGVTRLVATDPNEAAAQVIDPGKSPGAGSLFASLPAGLQITSGQRTPEHNREVGGVTNSYHLTDQARDIVPRNPQEAAAVQQWAAQNGMEVINEGDHLHVEPRGNAPHVNPFASRTKEAEAAAVEAAKADVQTNTAAGIEANKQFGQDAGKAYTALQESGRAGTKERARLSILREQLKDTYTGPGANMLVGMKRVANAFGVKVDGLGEAETARALSNQLALSLRNPAGGEGMPGAMSDADRAFLQQSVPGLSNSPQGWRAMVDMRLALADSAVKQAQYAEQLRRHGVPIQDIPGMVQDFANQNPVFGGAAPQQSAAAPQAPASGGFRVLD